MLVVLNVPQGHWIFDPPHRFFRIAIFPRLVYRLGQ